MRNDLLEYDIIVRAVSGDSGAIFVVLKHFEGYIGSLSIRYSTEQDGKRRMYADEDIKKELEIELITKIRLFRIAQ